MIFEGIGCYYPVFPARCDDIYLWASIFVKEIVRVLSAGTETQRIVKYFEGENGSVLREVIYEKSIS